MNLLKGKIQKREGGFAFVETADSNPFALPIRGPLERLAAKHLDKDVVFGILPQELVNAFFQAQDSVVLGTLTPEAAAEHIQKAVEAYKPANK